MNSNPVIVLRIPKYERLQQVAMQYPSLGLDPYALEAYLVLRSVAGEVSAAVGTNLARCGIAEARFVVLALLYTKQPESLSHSKLAELSGVTKGNITGLVDGLERDGYVKREDRSDDRRVTPIALTPAGQQLVEKVLPDHLSRVNGLMGGLSTADCKTLVSLLMKVQAGLPALNRVNGES